jgi:primosomal protein N' (replication factor Y)
MTHAGSPRIVRVRTEVGALTKEFDYTVPPGWRDDVVVGTRVRVPLHGRTVRGWVVQDPVAVPPPPGVDLLPLKSWLGWGPPPALVELAGWAAWRWAGPEAFFLKTASPDVIVRSLPQKPPLRSVDVPVPEPGPSGRIWLEAPRAPGVTVVRLPPATDLIDLVLAVATDEHTRARGGSLLVLVPALGWAERLTTRLNRRGLAATTDWALARAGWPVVVGSRAGAWAPVPALAAAVVLDAHDGAYREESAPTYSAVDVAMERARRDGAPCVVASPVPPVALAGLRTVAPEGSLERAGWPALERVDRRKADPRTGLFSEQFVRLARSVLRDPVTIGAHGPLVCVYNRKGGARLLACSHCGEIARCARCGAAVSSGPDKVQLHCPRCAKTRPLVCTSCGRLKMRALRVGVTRLREELGALLGVDVEEVSGSGTGNDAGEDEPTAADVAAGRAAPVLIGTEAVLHRVRRAAAVVFLDIDLHLLAPRLSATEETLALLVRAARLVGPRGGGRPTARLQVQTRVPDHPALEAAARGEPAPVLEAETTMRRLSALPPFSALAVVSGRLAPEYAAVLARAAEEEGGGIAVSAAAEGTWVVQAPDHAALCGLLARVERPPGRGLRVAVDPASV